MKTSRFIFAGLFLIPLTLSGCNDAEPSELELDDSKADIVNGVHQIRTGYRYRPTVNSFEVSASAPLTIQFQANGSFSADVSRNESVAMAITPPAGLTVRTDSEPGAQVQHLYSKAILNGEVSNSEAGRYEEWENIALYSVTFTTSAVAPQSFDFTVGNIMCFNSSDFFSDGDCRSTRAFGSDDALVQDLLVGCLTQQIEGLDGYVYSQFCPQSGDGNLCVETETTGYGQYDHSCATP